MMRIIKKILLAALFILAAQGAMSQDDPLMYVSRSRAKQAVDTEVVKISWVRSHLLDEWFFQAQGGGQLFYGIEDREGPFFDRLTGNAEFQIGRRIFPMFGFRIGAGLGYAHGFLTKDTYNNYNVNTDGIGSCGNDAMGNPLGGYYWDYNNDLLIQKWKYFYFGADLFLNLGLFNGNINYDPYKRFNHIMYGGVHTKYAFGEMDTRNHRSEAHLGYIMKVNLDSNWSVYTDLRFSAMERLFDREYIPGLESAAGGFDHILNLHVGVMYKIHLRPPNKRYAFIEETVDTIIVIDENTVFTNVIMSDTIYKVQRVDTSVDYTHMYKPNQKLQDSKDSLIDAARERQRQRMLAEMKKLKDKMMAMQYEMVFFERDKWDILPEEETKIARAAKLIKANKDRMFVLAGSADSPTGTVERNEVLGQHRADTVYTMLVEKYGVDPAQLRRTYLGGITTYKPLELNRTTVIIVDDPEVEAIFQELKKEDMSYGIEE